MCTSSQKLAAALLATGLMLVTWLPLVGVPGSAASAIAAQII